jgi:hypothetical protein
MSTSSVAASSPMSSLSPATIWAPPTRHHFEEGRTIS